MARKQKDLSSLRGAEWLEDPVLQRVLKALTSEGGEARVAGGAVRNALMDEPVTDIDIATTETPERVIELARRAGLDAHPTGIDHGTITVVAKDGSSVKPFEVTTLRIDVETYGRHAQVAFTADWEADARRRDFTMNALYCDAAGRLFDFVGGYEDLRRRRVRFVGDPHARIREDFLRILRFFRFHARYGSGAPDRAGLEACVELQEGLARLSAERIRQEVLKLLIARGAVAVLRAMAKTGILARVIPVRCDLTRFNRMARVESEHGLKAGPILRLAALALTTSDDAETLRAALRLSNEEFGCLVHLTDSILPTPALREAERRIVLYQTGPEAFRDAVRFAWSSGKSRFPAEEWIKLLKLPDEWPVPRFPVSGADLLDLGIAPGPEMGRTLRALEDWWMASGFPEDKNTILSRLASLRQPSD